MPRFRVMAPSETSSDKVQVDSFREVSLKAAAFKVKIALRKEEYPEGAEAEQCDD